LLIELREVGGVYEVAGKPLDFRAGGGWMLVDKKLPRLIPTRSVYFIVHTVWTASVLSRIFNIALLLLKPVPELKW